MGLQDYINAAGDLFENAGTFPTKQRGNGDILVYDPATNTFGAFLPDGTPKTMFRPTPGIDDWNAQ